MTVNDISYQIRGAVYDVYKALGPGLLESVYEEALATAVYQIHCKDTHLSRIVSMPESTCPDLRSKTVHPAQPIDSNPMRSYTILMFSPNFSGQLAPVAAIKGATSARICTLRM